MASKYALHPDYKKVPNIAVSLNPMVVGMANFWMKVQRKYSKPLPRCQCSTELVASADGSIFPVEIIKPENVRENAPVIVYYHGGAFALTYAQMHLDSLANYCVSTGAVGLMVDYRLTPKHPFPAGFEDCYAALEWAWGNADSLGIDKNRLLLMGDSAGGAMVAAVAQKVRDKGVISLCGQMMIYPVLDYRCNTGSALEFDDTPIWNGKGNRQMWVLYLKDVGAEVTPYASPALGKVEGLPQAYIETAEFDPLRDEGLNYARAMKEAGVDVELVETSGTMHGFDAFPKSELAVQAVENRLSFLNKCFE
jgi:acetyl esterase/lipase